MWTYFIHDTLTGARRQQVYATEASFSALVSDTGSGSHTFQAREGGLRPDDWRSLTYPWANTIVQCWDDVPIYAGLVQTSKLNRASGNFTVTSRELRLILNRRFPFRVGGERVAADGLVLTNRSLRGLIVDIVRSGVNKVNGNDGWNLPVTLPAAEAGSEAATFWNYDFVTVENAIAEIEGRDGGPDVVFQPRITDGRLDWELRVGAPRLAGETFPYPMGVPEPFLFDVEDTVDGTEMLTGVFAIGKGSEADMRVGEAGLEGVIASTPYLDSSRSFKELEDIGQLVSHGRGELRAHAAPTHQWELKTLAGQYPGADRLRLGSVIRMRYSGDWWEPDSDLDQYLIGIRGDHTDRLTLDTQPLRSL